MRANNDLTLEPWGGVLGRGGSAQRRVGPSPSSPVVPARPSRWSKSCQGRIPTTLGLAPLYWTLYTPAGDEAAGTMTQKTNGTLT